jgi:hypothetical protein
MEEWCAALIALAEQVVEWTEQHYIAQGARVLHDLELHPEPDEPLLTVEISDRKRVYLEPTDKHVGALPTTVNLFAYPTLRRIVLFGPVNGDWEMRSSDGIPMGYPWNAESLIHVLDILAELHAAG